MKTSVLLTVHDREPEVLLASFRSLWRAGLGRDGAEDELVIVNDRSQRDYGWIKDYVSARMPLTWVDTPDYAAYRFQNGHNGPSRAFNEALRAAKGERVVAMSSDIIVTPQAWKAMQEIDAREGMWSPKVWDLDAIPKREYCGPTRLFPMPWFLLMDREILESVGGWDEEYLKGLSYDDNDVAGRVALATGKLFLDYQAVVYHQSHDLVGDASDEPHNRNRAYTKSKWGGIPFEGDTTPFDVVRTPHESGRVMFECRDVNGRLGKAVAMTRGIFQKAAA